MQDTFNLGWKLASVLLGRAGPELLRTYSAERHAVAKELIDFDREWAAMMSAPVKDPGNPGRGGIDPAELQSYFVKSGRYTAGTATQYRASLLTGEAAHQRLAKGFVVGMRFHSAPVVRLADAKPMHLGHTIAADGRWRLFAFAPRGDNGTARSRVRTLCDFLAGSPDSPIVRYTSPGADVDSVIDVRAVFQDHHRDLPLQDMPALLLPAKGKYGLTDYEKIFCPNFAGAGDVFDLRGIDRGNGCMILVRPDQYVAHVLPLDAFDELSALFERFMIDRRAGEALRAPEQSDSQPR